MVGEEQFYRSLRVTSGSVLQRARRSRRLEYIVSVSTQTNKDTVVLSPIINNFIHLYD